MKSITLMSTATVALFVLSSSCSSSSDKTHIAEQITGKYARQGENEYDYFKDTLEVRSLEDGKFDVQKIASWSSAKKSDPQRPVNKVASVWNSGGPGRTRVAELQALDTTLRITEAISGHVIILHLNIDKGTLSWPTKSGGHSLYTKVR